jgi:hypothetical protein
MGSCHSLRRHRGAGNKPRRAVANANGTACFTRTLASSLPAFCRTFAANDSPSH